MQPATASAPLPISVELSACLGVTRVAGLWRDLEQRADGSVFLSWAWIGSVLQVFEPSAFLVEMRRGDRLIGLALLGGAGAASPARAGRSLHLNETGDAGADRITMEYNGVLTESGEELAAARALIDALQDRREWRRLTLSGVPSYWGDICREQGLVCRLLRHSQPAPVADLRLIDPNDPDRALSRNSRAQIRRSIRHFEQTGPLSLSRAETIEQALCWFDDLERLHTAAWTARGKSGAFGDEKLDAFHRHLISTSFERGIPDLLRLRAGEITLGYLYTLRWKGIASAYQSGFRFGSDPRWRPGLVAHVMAMRRYAAEGMATYRFLAGEARYKKSLSTSNDELHWMIVARPSLRTLLEETARRLPSRLRRSFFGLAGKAS